MMRTFTIGAIVLAVLVVVGAGYLGLRSTEQVAAETQQPPPVVEVTRGDVQQTVTAPGEVINTHAAVLSAGAGGQLATVEVKPGDTVREGDVIARLVPDPFVEALEIARSRQSQAEAEHERRLREARLNLTIAQARLAQAEEAARGDLPAGEAGAAIPAEDVVAAEPLTDSHEIAILRAQVERANIDLARVEQGIDPALAREVVAAEARLQAITVTAPFDGIILQVLARPGEALPPGGIVALLSDPALAEIRTTVIEEDLPLVQPGQRAEIYFDANPEAVIEGTVARIVPQRVAGEDRPLYHVYLAVETLPPGVLPGMTADSSIVISERADVLRLPRALLRTGGDGAATVMVWQDGAAQERRVTVGLRGDVYAEILEGLQEGEQVVGE